MNKKSRKPQAKLTTSKGSGETEQEYTAWLLYTQAGSILKTLAIWDKVAVSGSDVAVEMARKLGNKPGERTLARWSKKWQWVRRTGLKLAEELAELKKEANKVSREGKYKIARLYKRVLEQKIKNLEKDKNSVSMNDLKLIWEMFRIEFGKVTTRGKMEVGLDENEQHWYTSEEMRKRKSLVEKIKKIV